MAVHVYPKSEGLLHKLKGTNCACEPEVQYIDPKTELPYKNGPKVIHQKIIVIPEDHEFTFDPNTGPV